MKYFRFTTVVWNKYYTDTFLKACLPSLFAPGNIPSMLGGIPIKYRIYTTAYDAKYIQKSSIYRSVENRIEMEIDVNLVDKLLLRSDDKRKIYNTCYAHSIKDTNSEDGGWIQIMPDILFADGCFAEVATLVRSGKRLILAPAGYRTYRDLMLPTILSKYQLSDGSISISSRDLVGLSMRCILPWATGTFSGNYARLGFHWGVHWNVKNQGILQRSYMTYPVFIYPENKDEVLRYDDLSIEATNYLERSVPNILDVYTLEDSDRYCSLDLEKNTVPTDHNPLIPRKMTYHHFQIPSVIETALIGKRYIKSVYARTWLKSKIRYRYGNDDVDGLKEWEKTETQSDRFVNSVFTMIELFEKYRLAELIGKKFRGLEHRAYTIKIRIIRGVCVRTFPLIELTMVTPLMQLIQKTKSKKRLGEEQ